MRVLYDLKKQKSKMVGKVLVKIFHNKTFRKVFSLLVVLGLGYLVFSVGADCFAQNATSSVNSTEVKISNFNAIASVVMKGLYGLLWPLLFVCGIALDNGLIYGAWLHLDAPLLIIWNIMKNFANFALGFLVIFSIVMNLLNLGKGGSKLKPKDVVTRTLIAGVLIQMSRFLPAAIIDVSTILTYSIGGLPMTILEQNAEYQHTPILGINAELGGSGENLDFYYTYGNHNVSTCVIKKIPGAGTGKYIVGPEKLFMKTGYFDTGYCEVGGWVYRYNHVEYAEGSGKTLYPTIESLQQVPLSGRNQAYLNALDINLSTGRDFTGLLEDCVILPLPDGKISTGCKNLRYGSLSLTGNDSFFTGASGMLYTVDSLLEKSKGFVGPFITIYSSLLDVQSLVTVNARNDGVFSVFLEIMFKLLFLIILITPLIALAIVLIVRIGILWVVIAAAPVLVLIWVFDDKLPAMKKFLGDHFKLENIIKLIFAPVIVVFAIGISMVFLTALSSTLKSSVNSERALRELGIEQVKNTDGGGSKTYSFAGGLVEFNLDIEDLNNGKDSIAYMIMMLFATGIIWFFLMAAVKMCGKTGADWGDKMQNWGTDFVKTMPILPIGSGVGIGTLTDSLTKAPDKYISKMKTTSENNLPDWLKNTTSSDDTDTSTTDDSEIATIVKEVKKEGKITDEQLSKLAPAFGGATAEQMVNIINSTDSQTIQNIVNNYNSYKSDDEIKGRIGTKENNDWRANNRGKTSVDALMMTRGDLNIAVQNDNDWKTWASGVIGGSVHTSDGVYIVDIVPGTESNPVYEILDRVEYEKRHFGNPIESVSQETFNQWQTEDKDKYDKMQKHLSEMQKWFNEFKTLENKTDRQGEDVKMFNKLGNLFTDDFVRHLSEFGSGNFNTQGNQGQSGNNG